MNSIPLWLKRRIGEDNLKTFVDQSIQQQPTPCSDFSDEFEYADNIISWACDDFLTVDEISLWLPTEHDTNSYKWNECIRMIREKLR